MGDATLELRASLAIARKELLTNLRYPLQLVNEVAQPLYQFLLPALLLGASFAVGGRSIGLKSMTGTENLAGYLFLGIVVGGMVATAFWDMAFSFKREMDSGTLEQTWLSPTRPETFVLGRAVSGGLTSVVASAILIGVGMAFFDATVGRGLWLALPALLLAMASMVGIGYLVGSACLVLREPNFFVDATNFVFAMISGVAFPVAVLPWFIKPVAYVLPTTYAVDLLRVYALGTRPLLDPALEWVALAVLSAVMIVVGRFVFRRTEHRMRVRGTLGQH
ncbi:MAG TPA: ABC transporter permease [Methylomirabilota bacterium]|jgi:ABC-2 type transport system permease protein|nr:ABC transporter permease [Methylomirabilota bacterium]